MVELTNKQKDSFFQTGFFILPCVFNSDEISDMKNSFQALQKTLMLLPSVFTTMVVEQEQQEITEQW